MGSADVRRPRLLAAALAGVSRRVRRLVWVGVALMAANAALILARVLEFFTGAPGMVVVPTALLMFVCALSGIGVAVHTGRVRGAETAARNAEADAERVACVEFLRLRAPDPAPGQCPVCSLTDLDDLGAHDEMAREIDPGLVRVVAYGPYRAHSECAAVVPYVAARVLTADQVAARERCVCSACRERRLRALPRTGNTLRDAVLAALEEGAERDAQRIRIEVRRQPGER